MTAPEIHANKKYSEKSDVFSAGALLYYLVAGRVPFDGNSDEEIKSNVLEQEADLQYSPWGVIS